MNSAKSVKPHFKVYRNFEERISKHRVKHHVKLRIGNKCFLLSYLAKETLQLIQRNMVAITIGYISIFREFQMDLFRCSRNVCSPEELTRTICETRHIKIQRKLKYRSENIVTCSKHYQLNANQT